MPYRLCSESRMMEKAWSVQDYTRSYKRVRSILLSITGTCIYTNSWLWGIQNWLIHISVAFWWIDKYTQHIQNILNNVYCKRFLSIYFWILPHFSVVIKTLLHMFRVVRYFFFFSKFSLYRIQKFPNRKYRLTFWELSMYLLAYSFSNRSFLSNFRILWITSGYL